MAADGSLLPTAPSQDVVRDTIIRLAVDAGLVTPYTSAVGVSLRRDPANPVAAATVVEVPLQVGATIIGCTVYFIVYLFVYLFVYVFVYLFVCWRMY